MVDDLALVHRFDQRGSGRSRSDGPFDVESFVADLDVLRGHWGHEQWVVAGHSWGANLALFYALAHPRETLAVIYICGTGLSWGWQENALAIRTARLTEAERAELEQIGSELATGDTSRQDGFLRLVWSTDFADRVSASVLDSTPLYDYPRNERVFNEASHSYKKKLDAGVRDEVAALAMPVLVIHGAHDTDPDRAQEVAQLAPHGLWVPLHNAAHSPWLEEPEVMRGHMRAFLRSLAA
jgi:proline iminopeptidase